MKKMWTFSFYTDNQSIRCEIRPRTPDQYGALNGLVAIDPGKSVGWSFHSSAGIEAFGFTDTGDESHGNSLALADSLIRAYRPAIVGIESASVYSGAFANLSPIEIAAIFKAVAQHEGVKVLTAMPNTVKAFLGDGRMKKNQVREAVRDRFPDLPAKYPHSGRERIFPAHCWDSIALGMYLSSRK